MPSIYKRVQIIVNPAAGKDEAILNKINTAFAGSGIDWEAGITHKFGDATRLAKQAVPMDSISSPATAAMGPN